MATLTIKNPPDPLYTQPEARAAANRRSINSEAILALECALTESPAGGPTNLLATFRRSRARLKGLSLTDKELRAARESGRA